MKKLALALATTAILGLAAPAFAAESGTAAKARTPVAQANVHGKTNKAKVVHHRHGMNKLVRHDRGLHKGIPRSRYYASAKTKHKSVRPNATAPQ